MVSIQGLDFAAVEMAARRQALRLAARALEQRLNAECAFNTCAKGIGLPTRKLKMAGHAGEQSDGSAKTREAKLDPLQTPDPTAPISPSACCAKSRVAVSPMQAVVWCWAMARLGTGTRRRNCFPTPFKFSTFFKPKNVSVWFDRPSIPAVKRARNEFSGIVTNSTTAA